MVEALLREEERALLRTVRSFVAREVVPMVEEHEDREEFPKILLPKLGQLGLLGAMFPEEYGGSAVGVVAQMLVVEELGRAAGGVAATVLVQVLALNPIAAYGSAEQKQKYLVPGIAGNKAGAIAVTEPNHGSDVASITTRAVRTEGGWQITGTKMFITNAPFADFVLVGARTGPGEGRHGLSLLIVERNAPGYTISRRLAKLGWRTSETAELSFEDCIVQQGHLIGQQGRGFYYIMEDFNLERLLLAAQSVGMAAAALDLAVEFSKSRLQFGQPISNFQAIRHKLAEMATHVEAARHLAYNAARLTEAGVEAVKEISMAKYFATEMVNRVCYDAIQVHGGYGFMTEYPIQRYYRDARVMTIGGGTSEIQKNIIAKRMGL